MNRVVIFYVSIYIESPLFTGVYLYLLVQNMALHDVTYLF